MTDLAHNTPLAVWHLRLPRLRLHKFGFGSTIAAAPALIMQAFSMAYVDSFQTQEHLQILFSDVDLEGRDPDW
jgi:hypothetical protein